MRTLERPVCAAKSERARYDDLVHKSERHHAAHRRVMAFGRVRVRVRVGRDAQASGSAQPRKCRA
jgi:hypothetical protein